MEGENDVMLEAFRRDWKKEIEESARRRQKSKFASKKSHHGREHSSKKNSWGSDRKAGELERARLDAKRERAQRKHNISLDRRFDRVLDFCKPVDCGNVKFVPPGKEMMMANSDILNPGPLPKGRNRGCGDKRGTYNPKRKLNFDITKKVVPIVPSEYEGLFDSEEDDLDPNTTTTVTTTTQSPSGLPTADSRTGPAHLDTKGTKAAILDRLCGQNHLVSVKDTKTGYHFIVQTCSPPTLDWFDSKAARRLRHLIPFDLLDNSDGVFSPAEIVTESEYLRRVRIASLPAFKWTAPIPVPPKPPLIPDDMKSHSRELALDGVRPSIAQLDKLLKETWPEATAWLHSLSTLTWPSTKARTVSLTYKIKPVDIKNSNLALFSMGAPRIVRDCWVGKWVYRVPAQYAANWPGTYHQWLDWARGVEPMVEKTLYFVPHMVSCHNVQLPLSSNDLNVRTNARQRLLRVSNLPLEDSRAAAYIAGSEFVVWATCGGLEQLNTERVRNHAGLCVGGLPLVIGAPRPGSLALNPQPYPRMSRMLIAAIRAVSTTLNCLAGVSMVMLRSHAIEGTAILSCELIANVLPEILNSQIPGCAQGFGVLSPNGLSAILSLLNLNRLTIGWLALPILKLAVKSCAASTKIILATVLLCVRHSMWMVS